MRDDQKSNEFTMKFPQQNNYLAKEKRKRLERKTTTPKEKTQKKKTKEKMKEM